MSLATHFLPALIAEDFGVFALKEAYIDGAKAALTGVTSSHNPFFEGAARAHWNRGHSMVSFESIRTVQFRVAPSA